MRSVVLCGAAILVTTGSHAGAQPNPFDEQNTVLAYSQRQSKNAPAVFKSVPKTPGEQKNTGIPKPWYFGVEERHLTFDDGGNGRLNGRADNISLLLSYRYSKQILVGLRGVYENFDVTLPQSATRTQGTGFGIGPFFEWQAQERLKIEGSFLYTRADYHSVSQAVGGTILVSPTSLPLLPGLLPGLFGTTVAAAPGTEIASDLNADRYVASIGASSRNPLGAGYVEPAASLTTTHEVDHAYVTSAGFAQSQTSFTTSTASFGTTFGIERKFNETTLTPVAGAFADYKFGDVGNAMSVASATTFENGWTARLLAGLNIEHSSGLRAVISTEYGGIGDLIRSWRVTGRVGVTF